MEEDLFLRKVEKKDMKDIFNLSNDIYVRKYSINKEMIKWDDHVEWFENALIEANLFYVVSNKDDQFFGQIRFKLEGGNAIISISLTKELIGKGKSFPLLIESIGLLKKDYPEMENIIAVVSKENVPSCKLFAKAHFTLLKEGKAFNQYIYKY